MSISCCGILSYGCTADCPPLPHYSTKCINVWCSRFFSSTGAALLPRIVHYAHVLLGLGCIVLPDCRASHVMISNTSYDCSLAPCRATATSHATRHRPIAAPQLGRYTTRRVTSPDTLRQPFALLAISMACYPPAMGCSLGV